MYTSLRDIMSLVHYAFILVQRLMSAEQKTGSQTSQKAIQIIYCQSAATLQKYINFIK